MSTPLLTSPPAAELPPLLFTVPQAARMLAISRSALYDLVWIGELTPIHIGRSTRFTPDELERFIATRVAASRGER